MAKENQEDKRCQESNKKEFRHAVADLALHLLQDLLALVSHAAGALPVGYPPLDPAPLLLRQLRRVRVPLVRDRPADLLLFLLLRVTHAVSNRLINSVLR